ncbi:hypothetical protein [Paenibacillus sp. KN14-4R]|uniref:hypothetical protein n=1 Tax=Paenibacillus sp. KN14-4R TaxID=3445773 RepID=UPI003FA16C04
MEEQGTPQVGQIVKVLRGREESKFAVIVSIVDNKFVLIADGDKRKFDLPKKKNILHLQLMDEIPSEVETSLKETGRVTNGKLRFALKRFSDKMQFSTDERGE